MAIQQNHDKKYRAISISMHPDIVDRLSKRIPRYGDRSKLIQLLVEHFLDGKITVKIPERKL